MENRGTLVAADVDGEKLLRLVSEMKRIGVSIITPMKADWTTATPPACEDRFDRVLVDAPCSGLGVIRRNPDIKWNRKPSDLKSFSKRQQLLLGRLSQWVSPGGVLVYAVCSMEPEETDEVLRWFLDQHPEFMVENIPENFSPPVRPFVDEKGCFRTFPHRHHMDGFFAARMVRGKYECG